ncbi:MAG: glycosyltransferase 87 family protein, partial [Dehalococcoidia bacterium]
ILLRLPLLFCPPNNDCHRYAWEGRIQNLGFNPYSTGPLDPRLESQRDDLWQSINKKHYTTIYPPLAELEFRLLAAVHYAVKTPQLAHAVIDVGVVLALAGLLSLLGQPAWHLAIYALCPLVLASFAHAGHNDSLMILALIAFLAAAKKERWHLAGLALGLAILAKTVPAILLALLVRRSWRAVGIALLTVIAGYLLYIDAGWQLFYALHHFPSSGHFNNLFDELRIWVNRLLDLRILARDRNLICLALLGGAAAYRIARPRLLIADARWLMALVILMLPIIHFWYATWVLALVALRPRGYWAWLVLTATMAMYWQAPGSWRAGGGWRLEWWAVAVIWVPFFAAWMAETAWNRRTKKKPEG